MLGKRLARGSWVVMVTCLVLATGLSVPALGQRGSAPRKTQAKRAQARKSVARSPLRPKGGTEEKAAADRIVLRDGKELLGQVDDSSPQAALMVLVRREWVRKALPERAKTWEDAARGATAAAARERRERLAGWRRERPATPAPGDRITAWLDRELAESSGPVAPSFLMTIRLGRNDISAVERRSERAARALRCAWLLGLADPETTPLATLRDAIAGRGMTLDGDEPIALDRLLPPAVEPPDRWLLRRAATEVLQDEGLRFLQFGTTILPEPVPGQPLDPALGPALVEGTIRDALGVGKTDSLPLRLRAVAERGRVGVMVTRIAVAPDLGSASAESTLYYHSGSDWDRGGWRSASLQVGAVPPMVVSIVASDPQVQAVMKLIDAIGAGFVSPETKQRGLVVGTTVGGAVVLARTTLVRSLTGLAFDLEGKGPRPKL
ncbi:MAG TPA: hypothetical protein VFF52_02215 [Isosphaeraceae bacterium]|nr:hypothetical protein [Isosphaeraceae bacterium]